MYLKCMFGFRPTADGSQTYTAPQFSGFVQICLRNSCLLHLASRDRKSRAYTYVIQSPALLGKHQNFKRMKYLSFLCHSKCAAVEAHKYIQYSPSVSMKGSMFLKLRPKKNQAPTTVKLSPPFHLRSSGQYVKCTATATHITSELSWVLARGLLHVLLPSRTARKTEEGAICWNCQTC